MKKMMMLVGALAFAGAVQAEMTVTEKPTYTSFKTDTLTGAVYRSQEFGLRAPQDAKGWSLTWWPFPGAKQVVKAESIKVLRNDDTAKVIQWKSLPFEHRYGAQVRLEVDYCLHKDFPGIFVRERLVNLGTEKANLTAGISFSAKNCPEMPMGDTVAKVDGQGFEQKVPNCQNYLLYTDLNGETWGIICADMDKPERYVYANTPNRANAYWHIGYRTPAAQKDFAQGEFSRANFAIFPAKDIAEVKAMYEKLSADKQFDAFWKYIE